VRTAIDNAHEFGALTKQGYGVRLAVLVACSVDTPGRGKKPSPASGKITVDSFAAQASVARSTVQAHLDKWDRMIAAGWDLSRDGLNPNDADALALPDEFVTEFDALATRGASGLTGKEADIAKNTGAMARAIKADPKVAAAALAAVRESDHPDVPAVSTVNRSPKDDTQERLANTNAASRALSIPVFTAATELKKASEGWEAHVTDLAPAERRQVARALTEIVVLAESLKMNLTLDMEATR